MANVRQSVGFPTVAHIRKGTPKQIRTKENRTYEIMGKDLKNKFRIEFLSGTKAIKEKWHTIHEKDYKKYGDTFVTEDGYEVEYIRAMIPTARVMDGWEWSNKTYNASGMLIASADGEKYIMKKDPVTMETLVKKGEPYTKFEYGDAISYTNERGTNVNLKLKSSGKLSLFLPELGEFVAFELRTSSYIDSLNIEQNLRAIQQIADAINGGMAGGIPLDIYRIEVETPYFLDGKSHKGKQWFIQIKANSEWANSAIARLNGYAMGVPALQAPITFTPPELPASALEETDDEDGETPEAVVKNENVSEGVISEEGNKFVPEEKEKTEVEKAHDYILDLCKEKGGQKNKPLIEKIKEYEKSGNFKKLSDIKVLRELAKEIKKIKSV